MIRIAICDDRPAPRALIETALAAYYAYPLVKPEIKVFESTFSFSDQLDRGYRCDVALLGISAPGLLGLTVGRELVRRGGQTAIVYFSDSGEYAVQAFALNAVHYLLLPFTQHQFHEAMDRATASFRTKPRKYLVVKSAGGNMQMVDIDEISYIESWKHVLTVYTRNDSFTEGRRSLSRILEELEKLSPGQFIAPYKGYLVNQKSIAAIEPAKILLRNGACVPIPKRGLRKVQDTYSDYLLQEDSDHS